MFNATADISSPSVKYLLDFDHCDRWQHGTKNASDDVVCTHVRSIAHENLLVSWVVRYDCDSKAKMRVNGFCTLDLVSNQLTLLVEDEASGIADTWTLDVKPCKAVAGKKVPQLLATNTDLSASP